MKTRIFDRDTGADVDVIETPGGLTPLETLLHVTQKSRISNMFVGGYIINNNTLETAHGRLIGVETAAA